MFKAAFWGPNPERVAALQQKLVILLFLKIHLTSPLYYSPLSVSLH